MYNFHISYYITPQNIRIVNEKILEALKPVGKEFGLDIDIGNIKYEEGMFNMTLSCKTDNYEEDNWNTYAKLFGMKKELFGTTHLIDGKSFTIIGLNTKSKKQPVICIDDNGSKYGLSTNSFK